MFMCLFGVFNVFFMDFFDFRQLGMLLIFLYRVFVSCLCDIDKKIEVVFDGKRCY